MGPRRMSRRAEAAFGLWPWRGGLWLSATAFVLASAAPLGAAGQSGPGSAAATLLGFPAGARPAALGNAYAALADDELSVFYNPAGLARAPRLSAGASYEIYALDVGLAAGAVAWALGPGHAGVGVRYADYGEIAEIEPDPAFGGQRGRATGQTLSAADLALTASYGLPVLGGRAMAGAGATLLSTQLAEQTSSAFAVDLGLAAPLAGRRLVAALAVQHLGSAPAPAERSAPLPRTVRAGLAGALPAASVTVRATVELVARRDAGTGFAGGVEVEVPATAAAAGAPALVFRAGLAAAGKETVRRPFSAGAAVRLRGLSVEYAYRSFDLLGATHRFGARWARD